MSEKKIIAENESGVMSNFLQKAQETSQNYDMFLQSRNSVPFYGELECGLFGKATKTCHQTMDGKEHCAIRFSLDKANPNNSSLCSVRQISGEGTITNLDKKTGRGDLDIDVHAGMVVGSKSIKLQKEAAPFNHQPYTNGKEEISVSANETICGYNIDFHMRVSNAEAFDHPIQETSHDVPIDDKPSGSSDSVEEISSAPSNDSRGNSFGFFGLCRQLFSSLGGSTSSRVATPVESGYSSSAFSSSDSSDSEDRPYFDKPLTPTSTEEEVMMYEMYRFN
ncbi:hypothetical protein [Legionella spiritensis]|uniref:hypothetical protein n=1 Tax=Legionella spiritensis TaxID=452 RepID=UPI000F6DE9D7|nr:hypothetical protein [Legionella spiritensis]VEG92448.1 Uncharacterised protein [Legionella spiritensis]